MDQLTSDELNRLVGYETELTGLGHYLSQIFKSFELNRVTRASELKIKLGKLRCNSIAKVQFQGLKDDALVPMYNDHSKCWNWDFPASSFTPAVCNQQFI